MTSVQHSKVPYQKRSIVLFLLIILLIIAGTLVVLKRNNTRYKEKIILQWKSQIQSTSRMTAMTIDGFISKFANSLEIIAMDPFIKNAAGRNNQNLYYDTAACPLNELYHIYRSETDAMLLLDTTGCILVKYPDPHPQIPNYCLIAVEDYKSRADDGATISNVFINKKNELAIAISQPVYYEHNFAGLLRWMITLKRIRNKYIQPFLDEEKSYFWLIDENKAIIVHHDSNYMGLNSAYILKDLQLTMKLSGYSLKKSKKYLEESEEFFDKIENEKEGFGNYIDFAHGEYCLAFFRKLKVQDKTWTIIMNVPYDYLLDPFYKHAWESSMLAAAFVLATFLVSFIFFRVNRIKSRLIKEKAYLEDLAHKEKTLKEERQKHLNALLDGQEIERNRISREIHDGIGQYLLAMKLRLQNVFLNNAATENLSEAEKILAKTLDETKRISNNLLPLELIEMGLLPSLTKLIKEFEASSGIQTDFVHYQVPEKLGQKTKTYIYRIIQEALSNIIKHAKASEVNIQILCSDQKLTLLIQDNGKGFDNNAQEEYKGNGLNNIKNRVSILSGTFTIESVVKEGTILNIKIPLDENRI